MPTNKKNKTQSKSKSISRSTKAKTRYKSSTKSSTRLSNKSRNASSTSTTKSKSGTKKTIIAKKAFKSTRNKLLGQLFDECPRDCKHNLLIAVKRPESLKPKSARKQKTSLKEKVLVAPITTNEPKPEIEAQTITSSTIPSKHNQDINKELNKEISESNIVIINNDGKHDTKKLFHTKPRTAYHLYRPEFDNRLQIIEFIDDYMADLNKGKTLDADTIQQKFYNHYGDNCICENIASNNGWDIAARCKCENLKEEDHGSNNKNNNNNNNKNKSKSKNKNKKDENITKYNIDCNDVPRKLHITSLSNYYIKKRAETTKYIFLETDEFTQRTVIHTQIQKLLPNNITPLYNSGVCKKDKRTKTLFGKNYQGYNLLGNMDESSFGNGHEFVTELLKGHLDTEFGIDGETKKGRDARYKLLINFLLQAVCILGHLQSSNLEFFHGDFTPENVTVQMLNKHEFSHFHYKINDIPVRVRNLGIAVHLAGDSLINSSLTLGVGYFSDTNKKYRIIPTISSINPIVNTAVKHTIEKTGDSDPSRSKSIAVEKFAVSLLMTKPKDPTITILRAAGVRHYQDMDLYTFFMMLINSPAMKNYILEHRINDSLMNFMTMKFEKEYFKTAGSPININAAVYNTLDIFATIGENMPRVFTSNYVKALDHLNLHLFEPK